jgi:hypothetical protein
MYYNMIEIRAKLNKSLLNTKNEIILKHNILYLIISFQIKLFFNKIASRTQK